MATRSAGHNEALKAAQSLGFVAGSCICLVLSAAFAVQFWDRVVEPRLPLPVDRINPNEASVASMARLPRIGATRARAIVAFRDSIRAQGRQEPAFRKADDLAAVGGIGPATIEGIRPWLRFDPPTR